MSIPCCVMPLLSGDQSNLGDGWLSLVAGRSKDETRWFWSIVPFAEKLKRWQAQDEDCSTAILRLFAIIPGPYL